jgi:hypothetical protein
LLDDLKETFDNLRKYKMMLNPKKCMFGVPSDKLFGYMILAWGIDRRKSEEGGGYRTIAMTSNPKRNPEAGRHNGSTQLIHI